MRIAGPAHRRAGPLRLNRRHVVAWCIVAVIAATVVVQWGISAINNQSSERSSAWAGPAPGTWKPGPTAGSPTPSPTPTASKSPTTKPPHLPVPVETSHPEHPTHTAKPHHARSGPPAAKIATPSSGARVAGQTGVQMSGTAGHLGGRKLEVFDFAPNGVYYLASDGGPVPVSGGHWSFRDATIGNGDTDVGKPFVLTVVIADGSCQDALRSAPRDAQNNVSYASLPAGCHAADSVKVTKSSP